MLTFADHGAQRVSGSLSEQVLDAIAESLSELPAGKPGVRVTGNAALLPHLAADGAIGTIAAAALCHNTRPVRAILFDKSAAANWGLRWHQDRTIAVRDRVAVDGFGPWSVKAGQLNVAPPFELLAEMVTLRVHLDAVDPTNAPLLIAPGSHHLGLVPEPEIPRVVERCGVFTCLAERGDVWLYATPIVHASDPAAPPRRRRVLQVDYCARDLPGGLEWLGM
jgi:hypothetical protein